MKVLFVRPGTEILHVPPPRRLLYLAASLRQTGKHEIKIADDRLMEYGPGEVLYYSADLLSLRKSAFRKFCLNPRRIGAIIRTSPNKWGLVESFFRTLRISFLGREF